MLNLRKKDKKAWLKVLEAFIAILIVISAVLYILSISSPKKDIGGAAYEKEKYILNSISKDNNLRAKIIAGDNTDVNLYVEKMIPGSWGFDTRICGIEEICEGLNIPKDRDIYTSEVVISSDLNNYNPKKLRMFVWVK